MDLTQKAATLQLLANLGTFDPRSTAQAFLKAYDVHIDWHEFAYYLDELLRKDIIKKVSNGIYPKYQHNIDR